MLVVNASLGERDLTSMEATNTKQKQKTNCIFGILHHARIARVHLTNEIAQMNECEKKTYRE